jgi:hypothetical protein
MPSTRFSKSAALAAASAGAAAWCSAGTLAATESGPHASRVGVLPPLWWLGAAVAVALAFVWRLRLSGDRTRPLFFSLVLVLPWLPVRWPLPVLAWTGPVSWFVWAAVAASVLAARPHDASPDGGAPAARASVRGLRAWLRDARRAPVLAGACAFLIYAGSAAHLHDLLPGGDEPHYLIIAQSLWNDGDLRIENNHQRGDYLEYFKGALRPDYLRRGQDGQIYSIHLPGVSTLVAPFLAVGGYRLVNLVLAAASALAAAVAWRTTFAVVGSAGAAWFGWAAVGLTVPFLMLAFTVYPDGPGACVVLLTFAALVSLQTRPARSLRWWAGVGLLPAMLPWFHPRFAVIAAALGLAAMWRALGGPRRLASAAAFAAAPLLSAVAWFAYYTLIYGRPDPSLAYGHYTQMSASRIPAGVTGLFVDQQYGLLIAAPVYAIALCGLVPFLRRQRRLALEWLAIVVPYTLVTAMYYMWWGGFASPARFIGATLLLYSIPAAMAFDEARHAVTRAAQAVALSVSLATSAICLAAEGGQFSFNVRESVAPFFVWLGQLADVGRSLPGSFRGGLGVVAAEAATWLALLVVAWLAARTVAAAGRLRRGASSLAWLALSAVAMTAAIGIGWRVEAASGLAVTTGQLRLLSAIGHGRAARGATFDPVAVVAPAEAAERLRIGGERVSGAPAGTWLWVPHVPAGHYRLWVENRAPGAGLDAAVFVGRVDVPIERWQVESLPGGAASRDLRLPVDVHSIAVRGSDAARRGLGGIWLQPIDAGDANRPVAAMRASSGARYGETAVFCLGDAAYLEPGGLWTAGNRTADLVLLPGTGRSSVHATVSAGAAAVRARVEAGGFSSNLDLSPGQRAELDVPVPPDVPTLLRIRSDGGFRPVAVDARSADLRLLGLRIELR